MNQSSPHKLATALRTIFALQSREIERNILSGRIDTPIDLSHWIPGMAKSIAPSLQEYTEIGVRKVAIQLGIDVLREYTAAPVVSQVPSCIDHMRHIATIHGGRSYNLSVLDDSTAKPVDLARSTSLSEIPLKSLQTSGEEILQQRTPERFKVDFSRVGTDSGGLLPLLDRRTIAKAVKRSVDAILHRNRTAAGFNPRTIDAINQTALQLCRETLETTSKDVNTAIEEVRIAIRRHLTYSTRYGPIAERGEIQHVLKSLAESIRKIFNDPARANRIAVTEYSRAINVGQLLEAGVAPFPTRKVWNSAPGSCKKCRALNGKRRRLDQVFTVDEEHGVYAIIMTPPYHPFCTCKMRIVRAA